MTRHERILTWELESKPEDVLRAEVSALEAASESCGDPTTLKSLLHGIVPEYREPTPEELQLQPQPERPDVELPASSAANLAAPFESIGERVRHAADVAAALVLLGLSVPLWVALTAEARLNGTGEILTNETRVGRNRRRADRRGSRNSVEIDRRSFGRRTQDLFGEPIQCSRFRHDLGPLSRWVARRRLDKLPWLVNVLRGDMALVGPKPEKQELVLRFASLVPDYVRRFTVRPGLTGLAQVSGVPDSTAEGVVRRVHYDLFYVDHRSFLLDLRTLLRTAGVILRRPRLGEPSARPAADARPAA